MKIPLCAAALAVSLLSLPALAAEDSNGKILLERNCGRCHAVTPGTASPLAKAPNLYVVLGAYPGERLELELGEGIGSLHKDMPQVQFSGEDISDIYYYLHDEEPGSATEPPP
jgi:mono/diheme cytochrome c family protein